MPNVPNNTPIVDNLAHGFDRNDGTGGKGGTPTKAGQINVHTANGVVIVSDIPVEELEDSPIIERAEQCTATHHFRMSDVEATNRLNIYSRGALLSDSYGNYFRVLCTTKQRQKAGKALLSVVSESISFDVPPDEYNLKPVKLGLDIMKHPRYFYALMPTNQIPDFTGTNDTNDQINAKQTIIRAIQAYRENPVLPTSSNINNMVGQLHDQIQANLSSGRFTITRTNPNFKPSFKQTNPIDVGASGGSPPITATVNGRPNPATYFYYVDTNLSDPNGKIVLALAAAKELIGKLWRMEDSPPVNGLELTWSEYYFRPPWLNLGGYVENPVTATPGFPDYFYSTAYPPNSSQTIFDRLSYYNPQCYAVDGQYGGPVRISWLRDADDHDFQRTWFKITRRWLGAPIGAWDADINSSGNRPTLPAHYRNLILS